MGKGKSKIEIKKIESLQARNVCFSKRRKGLFKKAAELGRLFPEVRIAAVVFSPAGNPYVFGDAHALLSGSNEIVPDHVSEIQKLLTVDFESMGVDDLKVYASQLEKSRSALLLNGAVSEEKEKGDMDSTVKEISEIEKKGEENIGDMASTVMDSTLEEITESEENIGDMASKVVTDFTVEEINVNDWFCVHDTTFASSSLCLEIPILDSDFSAADFDGLDEEAFVNQFLNC